MKWTTLLLLVFLQIPYLHSEPKRKISLQEFSTNYEITGALGVPLGTAVKIEVEVASGRELASKISASRYYLRVLKVAGMMQEKPFIIDYSPCPGCSVNLPRNGFELYTYKNPGKKVGTLTSEQIEQLEKGYVGKKLALMVYETGGYSGIPKLNDRYYGEYALWQDVGFYFRTSLMILKEPGKGTGSSSTRE